MNWFVIYTKPKWEKKIANRLIEIGINAYCPLIKKESKWSDRIKIIDFPLFNNYIFVQLEEKNRNEVFVVPGVVRYLFWLGKPAIVKDSEILSIKKWLSEPNVFEIEVDNWQKGNKIVLESGPFVSQTAVIQEVKSNHYLLILESLGCVLKIYKRDIAQY